MSLSFFTQVTAGTSVYQCSDRSSAYEIQELLQGGTELSRNLLLYGTPDLEEVNFAKRHLFPSPLGGLEGSAPETGWSFVQIPGVVECFFNKIFSTLLSIHLL